jgi:hypothetical protein
MRTVSDDIQRRCLGRFDSRAALRAEFRRVKRRHPRGCINIRLK